MKLPLDSPRSDHSRPIPALSQSRQGDMACDTLYVCKHVQGEKRVRLMLLYMLSGIASGCGSLADASGIKA